MRCRSPLLLAAFLMLVPVALTAQVDVSGDWQVTFHRGEESVRATMFLEQDGDLVTGVLADEQVDLQVECTLDGVELLCVGEVDDVGEIVRVTLGGTIENGEITGAADYGAWGSGRWSARRE